MNTQAFNTKLPGQPLAWPALPAAVWWLAALAGLGLPLLSAASGASLHVDEAQYWAWSQGLQWGYYSKPPGIAALLAVSTTLFGHGEGGVRALAQACYPAAALVLAWLAQAMGLQAGRSQAQARHAAVWAAALLLASPFTQWLGLVATTDAPLLLCWATAMASLWAAVVQGRRTAWCWLVLAVAGGLLTKYAFAAWLPGAALFVWLHGRRGDRRRLAAALALATLACLPHGLWNQAQGWPTLRHTAEITLQRQHGPGEGLAAAAGAALAYTLAQVLLVAPLLWPTLLWRARRAWRSGTTHPPAATSGRRWGPGATLCWASALPLATAGVLQAARGGAELNWVAPVHLSLWLWLATVLAGQGLATQPPPARWLGAQALLLAALPLGASVAGLLGQPWPDRADLWARMRGWQPALQQLQASLPAADAALPWVASQRTPLAQAMYHLRQHGHRHAMWQGPGPAATHQALQCRWQPGAPGAFGQREGAGGHESDAAVLLLSEGPPEAGVLAAAGPATPMARVAWRTATGRLIDLRLTRLQPPAASTADTMPTGTVQAWCR